MQQLLYTIVLSEMLIIMTLMFKSPVRKVVIMTVDRVKRGRGAVVVKTVAGTILVVFMSSVYSVLHLHHRHHSFDSDSPASGPVGLSPTDEVLLSKHQLEASLMGFALFLSLMIDRLHHYIRELGLLRKTMEGGKKHDPKYSADAKALLEEIGNLRANITKLESECQAKGKEAQTAKTQAEALQKQSQGLLLEYDRLLAHNHSLRTQMESMDQTLSQST